MRKRFLLAGGLTGLAGLVAGLALAAPANAGVTRSADGDTTLPGLKTALTNRIDLRLTALSRDTTEVNAAPNLTDAHSATLTSTISADTAGLTSLKGQVAGETTAAALKDDGVSMVDDYRVFTLVGPQVRLAIAGDAEAAAITKAQQAHDQLATLVDQVSGADTSQATADLAAMQSAIDAATAALSGQVDAVLAISPGPDTTAIRNGVAGVRRDLGATRDDLRTALAKGKDVAAFLKSTT